MFALQKYNISPNEKQLVKPIGGLVYQFAKVLKTKQLDFSLLQNQNPIVVYVIVYVITSVWTRKSPFLQLVFEPKAEE